jgi:secreted trypsin-like serine protease
LNDIAILKFSQEVTLDEHIQIACLPQLKTNNYPSQTYIDAWVTGFGTTSYGGFISNDLRNVKLTLYPSSQCNLVYPSITKNWNTQICAGEMSGGKDSCQGDSGGSLFVKEIRDNKIKYVSVGIVSYGDGCALPDKPGIYTRISSYLDWIVSNSYSLSLPVTTSNPASTSSTSSINVQSVTTQTIASTSNPTNSTVSSHLILPFEFLILLSLVFTVLANSI